MATEWPNSAKTAESLPPRWRRTSWPTILNQGNRRRHRWKRAAATVLLLLGTFHLQATARAARGALRAKYSPTLYTHLTAQEATDLSTPHWQSDSDTDSRARNGNYSRAELLAHRPEWQQLGSGCEGQTFTYGDVVVKVYETESTPLRNCVPGVSPSLRWPTEVSASRVLGGMSESASVREDADHLPVIDYFLSSETDDPPRRWHLLTPFQPLGSLANLARRLRESDTAYTARDVDLIFRPSLDRLLDALALLHAERNLCHDDIKLDNIFLASPAGLGDAATVEPDGAKHWLLADLGNVRQPDHPYHASLLWSHVNGNLPDCRDNDVIRLLKSYVLFLRGAVADTVAFDTAFFQAAEPWSRLFWAVHDDSPAGAGTAVRARRLSASQERAANDDFRTMGFYSREPPGLWNPWSLATLGREATLAKATLEALRMSAGDKAARWWGWVSVLGVPVGECDAGM